MKKLKAWIDAFRLRTLPLSFSLIFVGSALAYQYDCFDVLIFVMAIVTTLFLQILSNISNDYGDAVSGADFAGRKGPQRAVQSGQIGYDEMKKAIYVFVLLSLVSGVALLITAYPRLQTSGFVMMLSIGIASIIAAICYTIGKKPYGYIGLGDFFVFVFFGIVGVLGSFVLYHGMPEWPVVLPASSIGLLSVGVLNMNNMRDFESDGRSNKKTLIVRFGVEWGRAYQFVVVILALLLMMTYIIFFGKTPQLLCAIGFFRLFPHLRFIANKNNDSRIDTQLKIVAVSTLIISILFALGTIL